MPYDTLTPADLNISDVNNNPIEGKYRPSVALGLWTAIFRARPDVNAIVHTHSPYATAFSTTYEPVPIMTETMADWFNAPIPVAPYRHVEAPDFFDLPAQVLGDGFAVLLGQHGPITVGKNLAHALERAVTLEEGALTCMIARTIGHPQALTAEQVRRSFEYYHHRYGQPGQGGVTEEDIDQV
jgi:ribulose-5-phosphate 4-epimerase/fuculose-1-phosphate aldolase